MSILDSVTLSHPTHPSEKTKINFIATRIRELEAPPISTFEWIGLCYAEFDIPETRDLDEVGNIYTKHAHLLGDEAFVLISEKDPDTLTYNVVVCAKGGQWWSLGNYNDGTDVTNIMGLSREIANLS